VEEVIQAMKTRKLPGPGGICPELIKLSTGKLREMLRRSYERCVSGEYTSEEWQMSYITPIYKKVFRRDFKNYSRISILCNISRIYSKELRNLIEKEIDTRQAKEQPGFRARRFTVDSIFTLRIVIENEYNEVDMCVINRQKSI
jgi:hypothetical protein